MYAAGCAAPGGVACDAGSCIEGGGCVTLRETLCRKVDVGDGKGKQGGFLI